MLLKGVVSVLCFVAAFCMACEQQHLHASLDLPYNTMCHTLWAIQAGPVCDEAAVLSSSQHVRWQALPMLSSSFV